MGRNLNIDHQTAFRAVATAVRPIPKSPVVEFYSYEIASSTDWAPPSLSEGFRPNRFVEITTTLSKKLAALELYSFDMRPEPHARSIRALETLARLRGTNVGVQAAEAFAIERIIVRS